LEIPLMIGQSTDVELLWTSGARRKIASTIIWAERLLPDNVICHRNVICVAVT
jgi:hypothetical protein